MIGANTGEFASPGQANPSLRCVAPHLPLVCGGLKSYISQTLASAFHAFLRDADEPGITADYGDLYEFFKNVACNLKFTFVVIGYRDYCPTATYSSTR